VSDGTNTYNLYYDALGRCAKRSLNGATTYYIYDGEKPILEYSSTGIVGRNVYGKGIDEILMRTDPGANNGYAIYYAQDHEGSVTHLLDGRNTPSSQTGNVIEQYKYDSFGAPTFLDAGGNQRQPNATAYNNRFLFTGREYSATYRQQYVPAFTFYEYRARAYDPTLGRFMSEDPKGFDAGDYNFFRYCHNDPIDFTDPMGLQDTVATYSPYQTSELIAAIKEGQKQMADEAYNRGMANAQRTMHDGHGGAIDIGRAGYSTWSARSKAFSAQLGKGSVFGESRPLSSNPVIITHGERRPETFASDGTESVVFIPARHVLYERSEDGTLKSVGPGVPVREAAYMTNSRYAKSTYVATLHGTAYTDKWGGVNDNYRAEFTRPGGYATIMHALFIPGAHATQYVTMHANGAYEIEPSVATFH
jgi:RHS repeat-associated protein